MSRNPFTRKSFLTGLAATIVGTSLMGNGLSAIAEDVPLKQGVYNMQDSAESNQPVESRVKPSPDYTLEDFRLVYGSQNWDTLPKENKERLKQKWQAINLAHRKSTFEFYKSPTDFENTHFTESEKKAVQKAYRAAYLIQKAEINKRISGESDSEGKVVVPIFNSGTDMKKVRAEYLQDYPQINPDCLSDFYKDQLISTRLILMHEIKNYGGKRINSEFLKDYTRTKPN